MTDAPERIWIDACGGKWSPVSGGTQREEYIRADLSRPEAQGWQPIETAPKDNTARLVYVPENKCTYCVAWREDEEYPWGGAWVIFGGGYRDHIGRATHWMPLPEPPKP